MDVIIGIVGLAIIVGFVVLMQKGMDSLGRTANQKIFDRKGYREGQDLVSKPWIFQPNASIDEVKSAILSTVKVAPHVPPIIPATYLIEVSDDYIICGYGAKLNPIMLRMGLTFTDVGHGCFGTCRFTNWTEADGIITGQPVMKHWLADINTALRAVDPTAKLWRQ